MIPPTGNRWLSEFCAVPLGRRGCAVLLITHFRWWTQQAVSVAVCTVISHIQLIISGIWGSILFSLKACDGKDHHSCQILPKLRCLCCRKNCLTDFNQTFTYIPRKVSISIVCKIFRFFAVVLQVEITSLNLRFYHQHCRNSCSQKRCSNVAQSNFFKQLSILEACNNV